MNPVPVVLQGSTVRLEPLTAAHYPALYRAAEPSVFTHQLDWPADASFETFVRWAEPREGEVAFAITLAETGEPVGMTSYLDIRRPHRTLEIGGTWIAPAHQGSRVNPETKLLMLAHAFEALGAVRVQLKTSSENLQSQAAIAKLGAVREGILRNYQMRSNGRSRDTVMFSITDEEWPWVRVRLQTRLGEDPRARLSRILAGHTPEDDKEREDLASMRTFAAELKEPFSRAQEVAHFTGSAIVLDESTGRIVLVHHAKLHRWLQPGGHADPADEGEMLLSAMREAREETGLRVVPHPKVRGPLDVDVHVIPARKTEGEHRHLDVRYLLVAKNPEALQWDPAESFGARWVGFEEALEVADEPALKRMLRKAQRVHSGA